MVMLIAALAVMTLICLVLGRLCYRLDQRLKRSGDFTRIRLRELEHENDELRRFSSGVVRVLNASVGGISKRLSESTEIVETINHLAPELFRKDNGLIYWLHANDQFLVQLAESAAEGIDRSHRRSIDQQKRRGRDSAFLRVYENAGLRPPAPTTSHDAPARAADQRCSAGA